MTPKTSSPSRGESAPGVDADSSVDGYLESDNVALISFLCIGLVFLAVLCTVLGAR